MPSSDEEAANPADKRAAETGEEPPAKKSRLRKEIHGLVKVVKDVVIGLTASTSTLDSTNESLQQAKKDIDALCIQLGVDQVSAKYFLTSMQQHSTSMNNISWQVTWDLQYKRVYIECKLDVAFGVVLPGWRKDCVGLA